MDSREECGVDGAQQPGDVIKRGALAGLGAVTDEDDELVGVMMRRLDLEVGAAADQRAARDEQLGEDRDRIGLCVRRDLLDDRAGQSVMGGRVGRRGPARRRVEHQILTASGVLVEERDDGRVAHSAVISAIAARAQRSSQIDLFWA